MAVDVLVGELLNLMVDVLRRPVKPPRVEVDSGSVAWNSTLEPSLNTIATSYMILLCNLLPEYPTPEWSLRLLCTRLRAMPGFGREEVWGR